MKKYKLDIVIPVYNNSDVLEKSIEKQAAFYSKCMHEYDWRIVIANNASTDSTLAIAQKLSEKNKRVGYINIKKQGRGNALRTTWLLSKADFVCYMDVDLATDLEAFPFLISNLVKGYDLSIGSKYIKGAKYKRHFSRNIISKSFNLINKIIFNARFTDAQCGFKAMTREAALKILPKTKDSAWFFDTELLVYAQKFKFKIKEVPIKWTELGMAKKSGVKMFRTILDFIAKMIDLRLRV